MSRLRVVNQLQQPKKNNTQKISNRITYEIIFAIKDNLYLIQNRYIPTAGQTTFKIGDSVSVMWKNGKPFVILGHSFQKAQFPPSISSKTYRVEELLLIKIKKVWDVWYRNDTQFVPLNLSKYINKNGDKEPEFEIISGIIRWGQGTNTFVVPTSYRNDQTVVFSDGTSHVITLNTPKFYVFSLKGLKATLVTTFSPIVQITDLSPINTEIPRFIPGGSGDVILVGTEETPQVFFTTIPSGGTSNPVWVLDGFGKVVSNLNALNSYGPDTSIITGGYDPPIHSGKLTATKTLIQNLFFVGWSTSDSNQQILHAKRVHFTNVFDYDGVGHFTITGDNLIQHLLISGESQVSYVPDQKASWSYSDVLNINGPMFPPFAAELMGATILYSFFTGGFGGGRTSGQHILTQAAIYDDPIISLPNPNLPGFEAGTLKNVLAGLVEVKEKKLVISTTYPNPMPNNAISPAFFRWLKSDVLYCVASGINLSGEPSSFQRDQAVSFNNQSLILYPPTKLRTDPNISTVKMKSWPKTFPPYDEDNLTEESIFVLSQNLTAYRLAP